MFGSLFFSEHCACADRRACSWHNYCVRFQMIRYCNHPFLSFPLFPQLFFRSLRFSESDVKVFGRLGKTKIGTNHSFNINYFDLNHVKKIQVRELVSSPSPTRPYKDLTWFLHPIGGGQGCGTLDNA